MNLTTIDHFKRYGSYIAASAKTDLGTSNSATTAPDESVIKQNATLRNGASPGGFSGAGGYTRANISVTVDSTSPALADFVLLVQPHPEATPSELLSGSGWASVAGPLKAVVGTINTLASGATGFASVDLGPNYAFAFQAKSAATDIVSNGTFTGSATSWTLGTGWSYTSNTVTASAASSTLSQAKSAMVSSGSGWTSGQLYEVIFTISNYSAGGLQVGTAANASQITDSDGVPTGITANGTYTALVLSDGASSGLVFTGSGFTGTIDAVSMKQCATVFVRGALYR